MGTRSSVASPGPNVIQTLVPHALPTYISRPMRRLLAGIFLFALSFPVAALAETKGEVEAIGFGSLYRPNCHIPMLVRVQADKSGTYQIRVVQDDLDADQPLF